MTDAADKPPFPPADNGPSGPTDDGGSRDMLSLRAFRKDYAGYPPFRKFLTLAWAAGTLLLIALCLGLALFAPPTVLSEHPGLKVYVDFVAGYVGSVRTLSVGALHPQVSQLVLAAGWGVAPIVFFATLLYVVIYVLVLDFPASKARAVLAYEKYVIRRGILIEILVVPIVVSMFVTVALGDLGVIHSFSFIRGIGLTKAENPDGAVMSQINMLMYTSRWGLGIIGALNILTAVGLYTMLLPGLIVLIPLWLGNMRRRLTGWRAKPPLHG